MNIGEPMTSYSYYLKGNLTKANEECANNVIYFPNATTISNLQNAMVKEVGYIVDGTTYKVGYNNTNKSFNMTQNHTVSSWGAKSVEAYVVTTDVRRYSASTTVHITGLPYVVAPPTKAAGWTGPSSLSYNFSWKDSYVQLGNVAGSGDAYITSPAFNDLPGTINTQFIADTRMASLKFFGWIQTTFNLYSGSSKVISQDSGEQKDGKDFYLTGNGTMSKGTVIKLESTYTAAGPWVQVRSLKILYR